MLNKVSIMITGIGAPGAPGIINCLRKNGERDINIIGVDMNENANGRKLADKFYKVPAANNDLFVENILKICESEKVTIIFPLVTKELLKLSKYKEEFAKKNIFISVDTFETLQVTNNKANLLSKMQELGMETPIFRVANTVEEVKTAILELGYPKKAVCVKGAEGNGSRGVRIIDAMKSNYDLLFHEKPNSKYMSFNELLSALGEKDVIPQMLVMEYLPGGEYGVDALCEDGEIICIAGRSNSSVNNSIPQGCIIENREEPIKIATSIINKLKLSGNINFDFIYDGNNNARLIEINPRLSATIVSYLPAGINFPYLRLKQILGEKITVNPLHEGIVMQRRYVEIFFDENGNEISW